MSTTSFIGLFLGQLLSSIQRKSLSVCTPSFINKNGYNKIQIGTISSWFSLTYGISKFVGGILSDIVPSDLLFGVSMLFASIALLCFSYCNSLSSFCILWAIHGLCQGIGGPALTKYVCDNYTNTNTIISTDTVWSILVCGSNLGYLFGPFILIPLITNDQWQHCFKVLGMIGVFISITIYLLIYKHNGNTIVMKDRSSNTTNTNKRFFAIFTTLQFWLTTISSALTYLALKTMADWTALYLVEYNGSSILIATELMVYNEVGGIFGTFICGVLSVYIGRIPSATIFSIVCAISLWSIQYVSSSSSLISFRVLLFIAGAAVNGPKTLLPLYIKDFSGEFSGTIGGIIGLIGQLGCVGAGVGSGWILQSFGWGNYLLLMSILMLVVALLLFITYVYSNNQHKKSKIM